MLDLGSGVGSIGLLWLGQQTRPLLEGTVTMLEAQEVSVALCRRTLARNHLDFGAVRVIRGDLREPRAVEEAQGGKGGFDVITINPPYMGPKAGALPAHHQRARCRHETRGGVDEFVSTAAGLLNPGGRLCAVISTPREADLKAALARHRLRPLRQVDILFRGRRKSVAIACTLDEDAACGTGSVDVEVVNVQGAGGAWHEEYLEICAEMGM